MILELIFGIINIGVDIMQDIKNDNLELFFDVLDESNNILYEVYHENYFNLLELTIKNILASDIVCPIDDKELEEKLKNVYKKLADVDFTVEDVRKALQAIILRGFKETKMPNGNTTPDTLGIFFAYLITKLTNKKDISILDPLCGTGNLLFTVGNHLDKNVSLLACDNDTLMTKLTKYSADLMDVNVEIFLQDTLNLNINNLDFIIFDMPHKEIKDNEYFPYKAFLKYKDMLAEDGAIIGIVENDFFNYDKDQEFKKKLLNDLSIVGMVELPDEMFKAVKPKIIFILQKRKIDNKCFMVKLPSFTNVKEFNESLIDIENWFLKNNCKEEK